MNMLNASPARTATMPTLGVQLAAMQVFYNSPCIAAMEAPAARVRRDVYEPLRIPTDPLDTSPDVSDFEGYKERVRESAYEQLSDAGWQVASQYRCGASGVLRRAGITRIARLLPEIGCASIIDQEVAAQLYRYALERITHRRVVVGACAGIAFFLGGGSGLITGTEGEVSPLYVGSCICLVVSLGYAVVNYVRTLLLHEEVRADIELLRHREDKPHRPSFG